MRIAILTLPLYNNYGGILQCYALQTYLIKNGYEAMVLAKPQFTPKYTIIYCAAIIKRMMKKVFLRKRTPVFKSIHQHQTQLIHKFIKSHIRYYYIGDLRKISHGNFDAVIVGSDQIWRPQYYKNIESAFLDFTVGLNIKRIAYAVSFGTSECQYNNEQLNTCAKLLEHFDAISVREHEGVKQCLDYFNKQSVQMPDPTLLLTKEDYVKLIGKNANINLGSKYLLAYILDPSEEKEKYINYTASKLDLRPIIINQGCNQDAMKVMISIEDWLAYFNQASFIVTDSFHGCVFSILFNKEFISLGNNARGLSRFTTLLDTFKLTERLLTNAQFDNEILDKIIHEPIDFKSINSILNEERERAAQFLFNALNRN